MLLRYFGLQAAGTTVRTEVIAGMTTFLTMAYILFVNPSILSAAGMPATSVFVATCLVASLATLIMGVFANYPVACAPGMGLNAYFAFAVVQGMGYHWQAALGAVFISGCLFLLLTLVGLRGALIAAIPASIRTGITAGIGLFLGIIALKSSGIVVANPATLVGLGDLHQPQVLLAVLGFLVIVALDVMKVRGAILIGILLVTVLSFFVGGNAFHGVVSLPPSIAPTFFKLDIAGALSSGIWHVVLVFFLVELFDATGTLMGVAQRAGLVPRTPTGPGRDVPTDRRMRRALFADSAAIIAGAVLGTSSTTAYVESAAGVQAGGRTGLTALVVAVLFLVALFFAPLASAVPSYATAPALLYVACLMLRDIGELPWHDATETVPGILTVLAMPFTYSIANGIAFGFISYAALKLLTGRARSVAPAVWVIAAIFLLRYGYLGAG
ncbi:guanine permease [Robbsia andropogonis]|uniref:Guanine permease n=1 Tax=Robbsia andropogonis TaxID=28092 RepID=A0A0F5JUF6_9BURK|nr:NCS2 family permease [Robbsia andropogonis]KKB61476.1 guanine permease [Robbsia andropogonis]MCP1117503.1 NCS2 family permease [Robbsia andropogonis]MCP1126969.1 NCS2 family permease [Robbsia andropogonis]